MRVAYDISFLGRFFDQPGQQSGVFRVVEELLIALCERKDIALSCVTVCGEEPLFDSVKSLLYLEQKSAELSCGLKQSFRSRFGLERLHLEAFAKVARAKANGAPTPALARAIRALLYRLAFTSRLDRLQPAFAASDFDVFHSPFPRLPPRELTQNVPRVITVCDLIFAKQPQFMSDDIILFMNSVLQSIDVDRDWVACISEFTKHEFCEFTGMSPDRVFVTPLAAAKYFRPVDDAESIMSARQQYGIPEGPYLLSLAALQPRKNLDQLIRSFFQLLTEHPSLGVNLVLVGKGSWKTEKIFSAASSSQFKHRIIFTDYIPDEDLSAVYSGAEAFVFPSLYEGFGLPPLEAMQCGTPVITSNNTAFPEVVGGAGLMVDPRDGDALSQAMLKVLTDTTLRQRLSAEGLERARAFSWQECAEKTVELYRRATETA